MEQGVPLLSSFQPIPAVKIPVTVKRGCSEKKKKLKKKAFSSCTSCITGLFRLFPFLPLGTGAVCSAVNLWGRFEQIVWVNIAT